MGVAVVSVGGRELQMRPGESFTFGRWEGCTVCLDPADLGISRLAGVVEHREGVWWLVNRSEKRALGVVDPLGIRSVLAPGRRTALDQPVTVVVEGQIRRHALVVRVTTEPDGEDAPAVVAPGVETQMGFEVAYTAEDRLALVALFAGYLQDFPRHDPHPRTYADAAHRLGWPRTTLVKRIEHLRERLTRAGVPNLFGENALEHLAEYTLTTGVITKADLALLR